MIMNPFAALLALDGVHACMCVALWALDFFCQNQSIHMGLRVLEETVGDPVFGWLRVLYLPLADMCQFLWPLSTQMLLQLGACRWLLTVCGFLRRWQ